MFAEWSAECAAEAPVLVVPWSSPTDSDDPDGAAHFVDLRQNPYDLDHLPEAEQHPPLMQALRALNAPRSPVYSAKCDTWPLSPDEIEDIHLHLDRDEQLTGFASYIDLVPRDRTLFASFHQQQEFADRLIRRAAVLDHPDAALECVLRPALVDLTGPQEGFSISLYVKALGPDPETAWQRWAAALEAVTTLLRGKDFASA